MCLAVVSSGDGHKEAEQDQESSQVKQEEKEEDKGDDEQQLESEGWAVFKADGVEFQLNLKEKLEKDRKDLSIKQDAEKEDDEDVERYFIGEIEISFMCLLSENRLICKKREEVLLYSFCTIKKKRKKIALMFIMAEHFQHFATRECWQVHLQKTLKKTKC